MKLKYYLRGLGIGIVVTTLIFTLTSGEKESLSDAEIRERAYQLGMVDSSSLTLGALQQSSEEMELTENLMEQEALAEPESLTAQESQVVQDSTDFDAGGNSEETQVTQGDAENESSEETAKTEVTQNDNNVDEENTQSADTEQSAESIEESAQPVSGSVTTVTGAETVTITIQSGVSSLAVCRELEKAGLIEDAQSFDNYLCSIGYSRSINTGVFEIAFGTSEEEIAKIITRKR